MYRLDRDSEQLDISGRQVQHLCRSVEDVQVAMAGLPSQEATAYVFSYSCDCGFGAAVILHLKVSRKLALFFPESRNVHKDEIGAVLDEGLHFAESMGFILADLDIHLLDEAEKEIFWGKLPLITEFAPISVAEADGPVQSEDTAKNHELSGSEPVHAANVVDEPVAQSGDLPEGQTVPVPPSPQEMAARKKNLVENLGRFLASF